MPDPIQGAQNAATPPAPPPRGPFGALPLPELPELLPPPPPPMPPDTLARLPVQVEGWQPAPDAQPEPDPELEPGTTERPVYEWIRKRLDASMEAIVARRSERPSGTTRVGPTWDPATAGQNSDGSLEPPRPRATTGAPRPGQGAVTPTGLRDGNSVFRFDEAGSPTNFPILDQGDTNGCGTTSLAMMLNYMAGGKPAFDREKIDRSIRHYNLFTSPGDIADYAERQGLDAAVHSGTSMAQLRAMVDQGLPVQVLLDVSDAHDGTGLHYEVVTGYGTGPDGKRYVELANPWGQRQYMAEDAFLARWSDVKIKGFPLGIDRVAIAIKPPGHPARLLADDRGSFFDTSLTALRVAEGLTEITSGWARGDAKTVTGGAFRLFLGGLAAIPTLLANAAGEWGASWWKEGRDQLGGSPEDTMKGLGKMAAGGLTWLVTRPMELVGNVASRAVDLLASGAKAAVGGIGKALSAL